MSVVFAALVMYDAQVHSVVFVNIFFFVNFVFVIFP